MKSQNKVPRNRNITIGKSATAVHARRPQMPKDTSVFPHVLRIGTGVGGRGEGGGRSLS